MIKILVIEDDLDLNKIVTSYLTNNGYEVTSCINANDALDYFYEVKYDLIISDIMMPELNGYDFAKIVREENKMIPIIFTTVLDDFKSVEKGYEVLIDDYMVKPINLDELLLRIEAILRRAKVMTDKKLIIGNLKMDTDEMSAYVDKTDINLTVREFNILFKLLSYPKRSFSRSQLMSEFWDYDTNTSLRAVDVYITKLREKLSNASGFKIITIHGLGYKAVLNE